MVLGGIAALYADAPELFEGLTGRGMPLVAASAVTGIGSLVLVGQRRFVTPRIMAAGAVTAVLWGAGGQYPDLLTGELTIDEAAASR